jgi:hypothetical protein
VAAGELDATGELAGGDTPAVVESATGVVEPGTMKVLVPTGSIAEGELAGDATAGKGVVPSGLTVADAPVAEALVADATDLGAVAAEAPAVGAVGG